MMTTIEHARRWAIIAAMAVLLISIRVEAKYNGGTGDPNDPYQIATAEQLNAIGTHDEDWDKHFILVHDVNLVDYPDEQFNRIGSPADEIDANSRLFTGVFDGRGKRVLNFTWTSTDKHRVGLFTHLGREGRIKNVRLVNAVVNASGGCYVGTLAGQSDGTIINCLVVAGKVAGSSDVGGLVGLNCGTITDCNSICTVSGDTLAGGLIGRNFGETTGCCSTGEAQGNFRVGGLVGSNSGTIADCNSTARAGGNDEIGGLAGYNDITMTNCWSAGPVEGRNYVGGLVGMNEASGGITDCWSTSGVSGVAEAGGVVGENRGVIVHCHSTTKIAGGMRVGGVVGDNIGQVENSYSTGDVVGDYDLGGLAGDNLGSISGCFATGTVTGTVWEMGGLVGFNDGPIRDSYSTGWVWGGMRVGGLVGASSLHGAVTHCYAAGGAVGRSDVGGLVGAGAGIVTDSFWNTDAGVKKSVGGVGKTTRQLETRSTFTDAGWDFVDEDTNGAEDLWTIRQEEYPRLAWELRD
jgi:hypothetical protein